MRIKIILVFLLSVSFFSASAADPAFVVYFTRGKVSKNGTGTLKKGDKLAPNEKIIIGENASVVLICKDYKVIQLNKKGQYLASTLLTSCAVNSPGYTSAYFKYVWEEFTHPHGKPETNPGKYMKNVGAVSRGCPSVQVSLTSDTIQYYAGALPMGWSSIFGRPVLAVFDTPIDGAPIQKVLLSKGAPVNFEVIVKTLKPGEYYWQVIDEEGNGCERKYINIWEEKAYKARMAELDSMVPATLPAETAFAKAFVMQEHHFFAEAFYYYTLASKLSPRNKIYQNALKQFYEIDF